MVIDLIAVSDEAREALWRFLFGVDLVHTVAATNLPIDELRKTYDSLISSGSHTLRNYLFFHADVTADIFKRRW